MNSMVSPISFDVFLRRFPWATAGRRESVKQLTDKLTDQKRQVPILPSHPQFVIELNSVGATRAELEITEASLAFQTYRHFRIMKSAGEGGKPGEWALPLRAGDFLHPAALFFFAREIGRTPDNEIWYCHELDLTDGHRPRLITKMRAHWFTLAHSPLLGATAVVKSELWKSGSLAGQALQWACEKKKFGLVPFYLGYRRQKPIPVAGGEVSKYLPTVAPVKSVTPGRITLAGAPPVTTIMVAYRDKAESTIRSVKAVLAVTAGLPVEILLINNQSEPAQQTAIEQALQAEKSVRFLSFDEPFNYGRMHNAIVRQHAKGEILFFLNNDVYLDPSFDFAAVVNWASSPEIGTVGMVLEYEDGRLQSGGFRARFGGLSRLARVGNEQRENGVSRITREVFGSSFAACLVRRATYEKVGGLNELEFANGFGDLAFSLDVRRLGLHNIFLGWAKGIHVESASRGISYEYWEERELERRYAPDIQAMVGESMDERELRAGKEGLNDSIYDVGRLVKDWFGR